MGKFLQYLIVAVLLAVLGTPAYAASASGDARATVIVPITITKNVELYFGRFTDNGSGGTVTIATDGTRSKTGTVILSTVSGTPTAGTFDVTGDPNATYTITLPADSTVSLTGVGTAMPVNTFVSNPATTGTLSAGGTQTINVGATLTVNGSQAAGSYTGTYPVTVEYN